MEYKDINIEEMSVREFFNLDLNRVEVYSKDIDEWVETIHDDLKDLYYDLATKTLKYRYVMEPLKPIQINRAMFLALFDHHHSIGCQISDEEFLIELEERYGRRVELLEESE